MGSVVELRPKFPGTLLAKLDRPGFAVNKGRKDLEALRASKESLAKLEARVQQV